MTTPNLWDQLEQAFNEQLAGTTPPKPVDPLPARDATPAPTWPKREGREL